MTMAMIWLLILAAITSGDIGQRSILVFHDRNIVPQRGLSERGGLRLTLLREWPEAAIGSCRPGESVTNQVQTQRSGLAAL